MKLAHKRWLRGIAACFCLAGPAWGQSAGINPGSDLLGSSDQEGTVIISDSAPGGGDPSASVMGLPPGAPPLSASPDQIFGECQPDYGSGMAPLADGVGYASTSSLDRILWRAGRVNIDQYGINGGYTNINAFIPAFIEDPRALWFVNPRVNLTDQGAGSTSLGFGRRQYVPELDRVFGASFWWDYDSGHRGTYNQLGGSFESIGRYFSMRGNFSMPIGNSYTDYGVTFGSPQFDGNQIAVQQTLFREQAYQSYEIEAETPFPGLGRYGVDFGLGFYYLAGPDAEDTPGVSLRAQSQVTEDLWINTTLTNDNLFDTQVSVNLELTMPDGRPRRWFKRNTVNHYMTESVARRYRVPVSTTSRTETVIATNGSGDPLNIAFIDPNETTTGDGSRLNPFMSVAEYMALTETERERFGLIFVRRRNDQTDKNLNTTITLLDFQTLLGDGDLPNGQRPTITVFVGGDETTIPLPGTTGPLPLLSNSGVPGTDVVTLANGNQVAGFTIDAGGSADGIVGTDIDGFNIHDNVIQNVIQGINITSNTTPNLNDARQNVGLIENNTINASSDPAVRVASLKGISVTHNAGTLDLFVSKNVVSGFDEDANQNERLDLAEDGNGNGILDVGEDLDFDGRLDPTEDTNGNSVLDRGVAIEIIAAGGVINANRPTGFIQQTVNGITTNVPVQQSGIVNNTVSDSGTGFSIQSLDSAIFNLAFNDNTAGGMTDPLGNGIEIIADMGRINLFSFRNNRTDLTAGNGSVFILRNGGRINTGDSTAPTGTLVFSNNRFENAGGDGLALVIDNTNLVIDDLSGFIFNGNGDDGLDVTVTNGGRLTVTNPIINSQFNTNGDNGLELKATANGRIDLVLGRTEPDGLLSGNQFLDNGGHGASLETLTNGRIDTALIGNTATGNGDGGIAISANSGNIDFTGRSIDLVTVGLDGVARTQTFTSNGIVGNTMTGNGTHGMIIAAANRGVVATPFVFNNDFSNNTQAGLLIGSIGELNGLPNAKVDARVELGAVTNNAFNRDTTGTAGILFNTNDVVITMGLSRNQFIGGGPDATNPATNPNTSFGIGGDIRGGGLNMTLNAANVADQNVFQRNVDAHIGISLTGDSVNNIQIDRGLFDGATDDPNTPVFTGDGVNIQLNDTAILTGFVRRSLFQNNEGDGLRIQVLGNNDAGNVDTVAAQLNGFVIGGAAPLDGNQFLNNGQAGVAVSRRERGQFNNLLIQNNLMEGNTDGLLLTSANADQLGLLNDLPDTATIQDNLLRNNIVSGIHIRVEADADLRVDIDSNMIVDNGEDLDDNGVLDPGEDRNNNGVIDGNGILVTENVDDEHDTRTVTGRWTRNIIQGNDDDGINIKGNFSNPLNDPEPGNGLIIGDSTLNPIGTLSSLGNLITLNGQDGIDITQGGVMTIGNNTITRNGLRAANPFAVAGINIDGPEYEDGTVFVSGGFPTTVDDGIATRPFQDIRIVSNLISLNNGDGVEILAEGGIDAFNFLTDTGVRLLNNEITQNVGRGIDILVRPGDQDLTDSDNIDPDGFTQNVVLGFVAADITIIGNHVKGNGQEGIYVVTTNALDQSQAVASNVLLSQAGLVTPRYQLRIDIHENEVIGNGNEMTDFPASGIVFRIGTTDGGFSGFFPDGFATLGLNGEDANGDGILDNDLNGDGVLNASALSFLGGVSASITDNFFDGNFGDDVLFHSFRSTVTPGTGTTWDDMTFNTVGYQSDPLARLDLIFTNNHFNSVEPNNGDNTIVDNLQPGAYYDDADGTFKSRTINQMTPPVGGPFNNAARRRNAQRLPSRYLTNGGLFPDPLATPEPGTFLYPGLGDSTFRVRGGQNTFSDPALGVVTIDQIFMLDDPDLVGDLTIVDDTSEANGIFPFGPFRGFGELPWGWGEF